MDNKNDEYENLEKDEEGLQEDSKESNEELENSEVDASVISLIKKAEEISGEKISIEEDADTKEDEEDSGDENTEDIDEEDDDNKENSENNDIEDKKEQEDEKEDTDKEDEADKEENIDTLDAKEEDKKSRFKKIWKNDQDNLDSTGKVVANVLSYIKIIVAAFLLALFVNTFILSNTTIPSSSMEETIMKNDRLFGFRLAYKFSKPKRGDIIIFKFPDNEAENYIKRVIGLPEDTVEIKQGIVYVNGEKLEENYLNETPNEEDFGPYVVPKDSYFVLGDNRNRSKDSRYWENTYVHKDKIIAKAIVRYFPSIKFVK